MGQSTQHITKGRKEGKKYHKKFKLRGMMMIMTSRMFYYHNYLLLYFILFYFYSFIPPKDAKQHADGEVTSTTTNLKLRSH